MTSVDDKEGDREDDDGSGIIEREFHGNRGERVKVRMGWWWHSI
jgi:hypothetical protein